MLFVERLRRQRAVERAPRFAILTRRGFHGCKQRAAHAAETGGGRDIVKEDRTGPRDTARGNNRITLNRHKVDVIRVRQPLRDVLRRFVREPLLRIFGSP